jgi:hypothetical protein
MFDGASRSLIYLGSDVIFDLHKNTSFSLAGTRMVWDVVDRDDGETTWLVSTTTAAGGSSIKIGSAGTAWRDLCGMDQPRIIGESVYFIRGPSRTLHRLDLREQYPVSLGLPSGLHFRSGSKLFTSTLSGECKIFNARACCWEVYLDTNLVRPGYVPIQALEIA